MTTFNDLVATYTQYEGALTDGRVFYFRYRHGSAQLGIAATREEAIHGGRTALQLGDGWDGSLSVDEFKAAFLRLWQMREGQPADVVTVEGTLTEPAFEEIRAYLDAHPEVLRDFLQREARVGAAWLREFAEREERIQRIRNPGIVLRGEVPDHLR